MEPGGKTLLHYYDIPNSNFATEVQRFQQLPITIQVHPLMFTTLKLSLCKGKFPCKNVNGFRSIPVSSLSEKMNIRIPYFPFTVATLK